MDSRQAFAVALIAFLLGTCVGLAVAAALTPEWPDRIYIPVEEPAPPAQHREGMNA